MRKRTNVRSDQERYGQVHSPAIAGALAHNVWPRTARPRHSSSRHRSGKSPTRRLQGSSDSSSAIAASCTPATQAAQHDTLATDPCQTIFPTKPLHLQAPSACLRLGDSASGMRAAQPAACVVRAGGGARVGRRRRRPAHPVHGGQLRVAQAAARRRGGGRGRAALERPLARAPGQPQLEQRRVGVAPGRRGARARRAAHPVLRAQALQGARHLGGHGRPPLLLRKRLGNTTQLRAAARASPARPSEGHRKRFDLGGPGLCGTQAEPGNEQARRARARTWDSTQPGSARSAAATRAKGSQAPARLHSRSQGAKSALYRMRAQLSM